MARRKRALCAGVLAYRLTNGSIEVCLVHPKSAEGQSDGVWSVPKGVVEVGEVPLRAACREFEEETELVPLGPFEYLDTVEQATKLVRVWTAGRTAPSQRGRPDDSEVDQCAWFDLTTAQRKLVAAQRRLIVRLQGRTSP
jgi:predicted NUDIX family NTP pyrophosphohydrolase